MQYSYLRCGEEVLFGDVLDYEIMLFLYSPSGKTSGALLLTWINFNPNRISNHIHCKKWNGFTYPFPTFNGCTYV